MSDPSVVFFLQEILAGWQKECLAEEGGLEILLSMNGRDKGSTRFTMDQISLTDQTCPSPSDKWRFSYPFGWSKHAMENSGFDVVL